MNFKNIKKEIFSQNIEKIDERQSFLLVNIIFLIGHIIYFILFRTLDITIMGRYNYFSMVYYVVMIFLTVKVEHSGILIVVSLIEIAIHSVLATYCLGWDKGFAQFLVYILPIPFMPDLRKKWIPYFASSMDFLVFCVLKFVSSDAVPKYQLSEIEAKIVFYINSIFGFATIIYISSIFFFQRKMNEKKLQEHNELLRKLATTDPLTKLYNRRAMTEYLKLMEKSSRDKQKGYFVGLADIDDFKKINDTYGHDSGDEVLVKVSDIMMKNVPEEGCVCRWGGEEILFIIPVEFILLLVKMFYSDAMRCNLCDQSLNRFFTFILLFLLLYQQR